MPISVITTQDGILVKWLTPALKNHSERGAIHKAVRSASFAHHYRLMGDIRVTGQRQLELPLGVTAN